MKVKASTLIETLIAMTIVVTVIGISLNSIVSVSGTESSVLKTRAKFKLDELISEAIDHKEYKSKYIEEDGVEYDLDISFVYRHKSVILIKSKATANQKVLAERTKYVRVK